jgi:hypothetical protein
MNRYLASGIALIAISAVSTSLPAQTRDDIRAGARVRIEVAGPQKPRTFVGTLVSQTADTLELKLEPTGEVVVVPAEQARKLDVSLAQHSGAGRGAVTGFLIGSVFGLAAGMSCDCARRGAASLVLGAMFGGVGTGLGAVLGLASRVDEWTPVPVQVTLLHAQF